MFIRLAVVASQICEILRKFEFKSLSKVINLSANGKRIHNFLLVINSNFGRIFYRFQDIDAFSSKIAGFLHPTHMFDAP